MRPLFSTCANSFRLACWQAGVTVLVCASVGCRNRAYTEVYVDNMAAEIRTLEDQLYEYDHEYRALEQELASLHKENERLRQSGSIPQTRNKNSNLQDSHSQGAYEFHPQSGYDLAPSENNVPKRVPESDPGTGASKPATDSNSIIERSPPGSSGTAPEANKNLPPNLTPTPSTQSSPTNGGILPSPGGTTSPNGIESIKADDLVPPTIQPGTPMPPSQPVLPPSGAPVTGRTTAPNQLEINLGRIEIPGQLTSAQSGQGQLKLLREAVTDTRIVDLAFHGSLCRGHNFDDQPDDDGLYLVLQPKNDRGQFVPEAASLSIVVLDPAREGDAARISLWNYSASEVQSKIQPIGSSQGIHLPLPWNGPDPIADRVVVFARYMLPDGRKLMSEKEIFVSGKDSTRTVWVPRPAQSIQTATQLAQPAPSVPTQFSPSNLVRPASATGPIEPAPQPRQH